ncbi:MAG: hypothetical protein AAGI13_14045, partial [Pseudomonadota bacterium]
MRHLLGVMLLTIGLAGCAIGNQYDLSQGAARVGDISQSVSVAVIDQRPYVLSGDKSPNFIGLQRGGYGNPFDVTTRSSRSAAEDLTRMLVNSYASAGSNAKALTAAPGSDAERVVSQFRQAGTDRLLLIEMREWKTDALAQITTSWNLTARVFDRSGLEIATQSDQGVEGTGESVLFQLEEGKNEVAQAEAQRRFGA